jgi:hypothetical protein
MGKMFIPVFLARPSSQQSWNGPDSHVHLRWVPVVPEVPGKSKDPSWMPDADERHSDFNEKISYNLRRHSNTQKKIQ